MLIKDICSSLTDGSHNPPQGISESSFLMLSSKNVFDDNITLDEPRFLSKEDFEKENKRTNIKTGDILLTIVGTVGRSAVVTADLPPFTLQRSVAVLHPNIEVCNERYLMYALQGRRSYIENRAKGVAQKGIYLKEVAGIDIPVPSKDVQNKIVAKLDKVNSIIKYRRMELLKLDELVKARFVELFGDIKTGNYKFETCKLGKVAQVGSSHRVFTTEFVEEGVPFYRGTEIGELANGINPENPYRITKEHYDRLSCDETKPKIGDLLMPSICNKGQVWMVDTDEPFYYKDGRVLCISPNRKLFNCKYLEQFMREKTLVEYPKLGSGSTFAEFKIFLLKDIDILIPPIELQNQFAAFVEQVDKSKFVVQKALDESQTLFDSLMQEYFG